MEKTKLDQVFEKQLYSLEIKPQQGTWQRIAQQLPPKPSSKKGPYFFGLLLMAGLMLPALPLQQTAAPKTPPVIAAHSSDLMEETTQNEQKSHILPQNTTLDNQPQPINRKNLVQPAQAPTVAALPTEVAKTDETRRVIPQAPDSLSFLGTKPVLPANQKRKAVKIEVTIHPDAFLQSDSLQQAAPEARPRIIQSLLKQLKDITSQDN